MQASSNLIPLQSAVVLRGKRAWTKIKATAPEMRQLWREVGEALLVGRREHRADRAFAQWVRENGFEDMDRRVRADAMWLAENWSEVSTAWTPDLTHPTHMRAAHREALEATRPLPFPDLDLEASEVAASGEAADIARAVPVYRKVLPLIPSTVLGVLAENWSEVSTAWTPDLTHPRLPGTRNLQG
jgi:acyl-homoserine lactone acylase PvdQ